MIEEFKFTIKPTKNTKNLCTRLKGKINISVINVYQIMKRIILDIPKIVLKTRL